MVKPKKVTRYFKDNTYIYGADLQFIMSQIRGIEGVEYANIVEARKQMNVGINLLYVDDMDNIADKIEDIVYGNKVP